MSPFIDLWRLEERPGLASNLGLLTSPCCLESTEAMKDEVTCLSGASLVASLFWHCCGMLLGVPQISRQHRVLLFG